MEIGLNSNGKKIKESGNFTKSVKGEGNKTVPVSKLMKTLRF